MAVVRVTDPLALAAFVMAVFALAASLLVIVAAGYILWRYAYQPFTILRRDVAALNAKVDDTRTQLDGAMEQMRRRVGAMSDAELASIERRLRRDSAARASGMEERV